MISYLLGITLVALTWWMFSTVLRLFFYKEWLSKPLTTFDHLKEVIPFALRHVSPQNLWAQGFIDRELRILDQRRSLMLIAFSRITLLTLALVMLFVLQIEFFLAFILISTILFGLMFKKPTRWIQIGFLLGSFYFAYQWTFYQANQWIFAEETSEVIFYLTDVTLGKVLALFSLSIIMTLFLRLEFLSLWIGSIFFFAGGLAYLNLAALFLGETVGWAAFWLIQSCFSSTSSRRIQVEAFLISVFSAFIYFLALSWLRTNGWLDIRVMGSLETKKMNFLVAWLLWEAFLTAVLMIWGHFRAQSQLFDPSSVEITHLPRQALGKGLGRYRDWLSPQKDFRRQEVERKIKTLDLYSEELKQTQAFQMASTLQNKTRQEVESLKALLGALS